MKPGIACSLLVLAACGGSQGAVADEPPGEPTVSTPGPPTPEVTPAAGARPMAPSCTPDVEERCDAVDQNCDGHVDEGCGYETGALQITMAWNTDADVDLVVTEPSGAPAADAFDRRAEGACDEAPRDRIENAHWAEPAPGTYAVSLRYGSECDRAPTETTATVTISAQGRVLGVYNTTLEPGQTVAVAEVALP